MGRVFAITEDSKADLCEAANVSDAEAAGIKKALDKFRKAHRKAMQEAEAGE